MQKWFSSFRVQRLTIALSLLGAIGCMATFNQPPELWRCIFHQLSGLPCPSCGMTRALFAAAHGRFKEAFAWHPMGVALFAIVVGSAIVLLLEAAMGRRLLTVRERELRAAFIMFMLCLLLCWVIRLFIIFGVKIPLPIYGLV